MITKFMTEHGARPASVIEHPQGVEIVVRGAVFWVRFTQGSARERAFEYGRATMQICREVEHRTRFWQRLRTLRVDAARRRRSI